MTKALAITLPLRSFGRSRLAGNIKTTSDCTIGLQHQQSDAYRFTHSTLLVRNGADLANRRNSAIVGPRRVSRCRRKAGFSVVGAYGRSIEASYINILHSRTCPPSLMDRRT